MKKTVLITASAVLVLFLAIRLLKDTPIAANSGADSNALTTADKARIRGFWEIYREAGKQRLAGRLEEAHKSYGQALELDPDHQNSLYYFASISLALGKLSEAEKGWQRLLKINPNNARAHYQLGDLYLHHENDEFFDVGKAEAEYRAALRINKEESRPHLRLGHVELIRGDLRQAAEHFDDVIGSNFKSVEAYFLKGYVAWREGKSDEALTILKIAKRHAEPLQPVHGVLGEGDTKPGELIQQLDISQRGSMFYPYFEDISETPESELTLKTMNDNYLKLNEFLKQIKQKGLTRSKKTNS